MTEWQPLVSAVTAIVPIIAIWLVFNCAMMAAKVANIVWFWFREHEDRSHQRAVAKAMIRAEAKR